MFLKKAPISEQQFALCNRTNEMKKHIGLKQAFLFLIYFFFFGVIPVNAQVVQWAKNFGGPSNDNIGAIASDISGNIYTVGTFSGTANFGLFNLAAANSLDIFVTKTDATTGNTIWAKRFGGLSDDYAYAVASSTAGYIYCAGRFSGTIILGSSTFTASGTFDAFVMKIDAASGNIIWAKKINGTGSDAALAMTVDSQENIYTTGYYQGNATIGSYSLAPVGTNYNVFVTKLDAASGSAIWAKTAGGIGFNFANAIAADSQGNLYLCGSFESTAAFGTYSITTNGNSDIFVSKIDATSGNFLWVKKMGGTGNDSGCGIVVNTDGFIYATGKFESTASFGTFSISSQGSSDLFVTKIDPSLSTTIWAKEIGGAAYDLGNAICNDAVGNLYVTGQFSGSLLFETSTLFSFGNADAVILKIDASTGKITWATQMGGTLADSGNAITSDASGKVFVSGTFQLSSSIDTHTLTSNGNSDIFLLKLNAISIGIKETNFSDNDIVLFPNPVKNILTVGMNLKELETYDIIITNISSQIVLSHKNNTEKQIDLSELKSGIYFVLISSGNKTKVWQKILKE